MNFSLEALEYGRLKELVGRYVTNAAGRELLEGLRPSTDRAFARRDARPQRRGNGIPP